MISPTVASNPVIRVSSSMNSSGDVSEGSYTTEAIPDGNETSAASTPSTRSKATRAVVGQLSQVIPVTARIAVAMCAAMAVIT